jgi:hypothetical protein
MTAAELDELRIRLDACAAQFAHLGAQADTVEEAARLFGAAHGVRLAIDYLRGY